MEYATDYLYQQEAPAKSYTKGELANFVFDTRDELNDNLIRRARAVLGLRGVKNVDTVKLNVTQLRDRIPLVVSNEQLADIAISMASDTLFWGVEYA